VGTGRQRIVVGIDGVRIVAEEGRPGKVPVGEAEGAALLVLAGRSPDGPVQQAARTAAATAPAAG
jgi:hypothetical protein